MGGHTVFRNDDGQFVALVQESGTPAQSFGSHGPAKGGDGVARFSIHEFRLALFVCTDDLAIVDIMMPGKNGYEIIKEVRKGRYIPILVISAKVELSDRILGIDLGADDYITKPFEALEVAAKVHICAELVPRK